MERNIEEVGDGGSSCCGSCHELANGNCFLPPLLQEAKKMATATATTMTMPMPMTEGQPHQHHHHGCRSKSSDGHGHGHGDNDNDKNQLSPSSRTSILKMMTAEVFDTLICSQFLLPEDIASLLQVDEIFDSYQHLRKSYCKIHGTKLDLTYEDYFMDCNYPRHRHRHRREDIINNDNELMIRGNDNDNDNDVRFLIWSLEQQAFISAAPDSSSSSSSSSASSSASASASANDNTNSNEKPPSHSPDCLDCRMARFHSKKKCPCCTQFLFHERVNTTCTGKCEKIVCEDCGCHSCMAEDCHNNKTHCTSCFEGYTCRWCYQEFHEECVPSSECFECRKAGCDYCINYGDA
jgi:hypothetical protein